MGQPLNKYEHLISDVNYFISLKLIPYKPIKPTVTNIADQLNGIPKMSVGINSNDKLEIAYK